MNERLNCKQNLSLFCRRSSLMHYVNILIFNRLSSFYNYIKSLPYLSHIPFARNMFLFCRIVCPTLQFTFLKNTPFLSLFNFLIHRVFTPNMSSHCCPVAFFFLQKSGEISEIHPDFMALHLVFSISLALLLGLDSHTCCVKLALNSDTKYRFFCSNFLLFHPLFSR